MKHADGIIRSEIIRTSTAFIQALALYEHDMFLKQSDDDADKAEDFSLKVTEFVAEITGEFLVLDTERFIAEKYHLCKK